MLPEIYKALMKDTIGNEIIIYLSVAKSGNKIYICSMEIVKISYIHLEQETNCYFF